MNSNIRTLYTFSFLNGFRPHWPIAIIYFKEITGTYTAAMTIYSIVFFSQAVFEIPAGMFSDGFRRRRTMILGAAAASCSITCYALGVSFWVLAVGALLEGFSRALFSGTDSAFLYESLPEDERDHRLHHVLGRMNSMSQIALCLSAGLCAALSLYSLKLVLWVSVVPQALSFVCALFLKDHGNGKEEGERFIELLREALRQFRGNAKLKLLAIADTLDFGIGEAVFYFQGALFDTLVPTWTLGIARCLNHLHGFLGFWFAGPVVRRFGARQTLIAGTLIAASIRFLAVVFCSIATPFAMAATNVCYGPTTTARGVLLQQEFSDRQRATMGSMISLLGSVVFAGISTALGLVADLSSPATAIMFALVANSCVVFLYREVFVSRSKSEV